MNDQKRTNTEIIKWIRDCLGKKLLGILWLSGVSAVLSFNSVISALIYKNIVDNAAGRDRDGFFFFIGCYIGLILFDTLLRAVNTHVGETICFGMERTMKTSVYRSLLRMEYQEFTKWHTGKIMNHFSADSNTVVDALLNLVPGLISLFVRLVGAMAVLAFWNWRFCLLYVAAGLFSVVVSAGLRKKMKQLQKAVRERYDALTVFVQETLGNMAVVRAFRVEGRAQDRLKDVMGNVRKARRKKNVFSNICGTGLSALMDVGYLCALIWCGSGIINGTLSYGTLTAVLYLVGQIQGPFANLSSYISQYYAMRTSVERLMALTEAPQEKAGEELLAEELSGFTELRVEDVTFSYGRASVLEHANLCLKKGEATAIAGRSGIGKSTLFRLLLALYAPQEGQIRVALAGGKEIPVSLQTRGLFAYVPQGNFLFSGNIFDCVRFLPKSGELSEEEKERVREACRIACAEEFIEKFPDGYETVLGERGQGLSEGQAQRLAVARALYHGAPVLLLDEATSALDEDTESRLLENIRKLTDKTVLIVTHRKKALAVCSRVVRIREKRFAEEETK